MIDGANPGSGELFDWRLAEGVIDPERLIVSGGLDATNVSQAIAHLHPWGVDVSTGVESSPGTKDPGKLRDFIAAVRRADQERLESADGLAGPGSNGATGDGDPGAGLFDWQDD